MSLNVVTLLYLVASVCFIQALKGLSNHLRAIRETVDLRIGLCNRFPIDSPILIA